MNQTRRQRYRKKISFYQNNWFWIFILVILLGTGFFSSYTLHQNTATIKTTQQKVKKTTKKSKLAKQVATFQKDCYQTPEIKLTLTGGKITANENERPVLLIEYHFVNQSDQAQSPQEIWVKDAKATQNKHVLSTTTKLIHGLPETDQTKIQQHLKKVAPHQSSDGAIAFTLVNKQNITLSFYDAQTNTIVGTKPYTLTE